MTGFVNRRLFLGAVSSVLPGAVVAENASRAWASAAGLGRPTLGFSLYGMKTLTLDEAIRTCAEVGYDDIEPALMPGFSAEPATLSKTRRAEVRKLVDSLGLRVPALMENLPALGSDEAHQANLDRLARAAELGRDLSPAHPPLVETVLGGKPAEWESVRDRLADRLRDWAETAKKHDLLIAVKPHMSNALHRPADALWLVEAVGSPQLRLAYDYSHYEAQSLPLDATLTQLIGRTIFVHVKDGERRDGKAVFLLPGRGSVDYAAYFRRLAELGYSGSVTVEVSGMIHQQADYDPVAAAKQCYHDLAAAWEKAGLPQRTK